MFKAFVACALAVALYGQSVLSCSTSPERNWKDVASTLLPPASGNDGVSHQPEGLKQPEGATGDGTTFNEDAGYSAGTDSATDPKNPVKNGKTDAGCEAPYPDQKLTGNELVCFQKNKTGFYFKCGAYSAIGSELCPNGSVSTFNAARWYLSQPTNEVMRQYVKQCGDVSKTYMRCAPSPPKIQNDGSKPPAGKMVLPRCRIACDSSSRAAETQLTLGSTTTFSSLKACAYNYGFVPCAGNITTAPRADCYPDFTMCPPGMTRVTSLLPVYPATTSDTASSVTSDVETARTTCRTALFALQHYLCKGTNADTTKCACRPIGVTASKCLGAETELNSGNTYNSLQLCQASNDAQCTGGIVGSSAAPAGR